MVRSEAQAERKLQMLDSPKNLTDLRVPSTTIEGTSMTKNRMRPIHPGEVLRKEFLMPLGMTAHALSQAIRVPATRVNDIVNGKRGVTADTALRLARYFGNSPEFWLNLQAAHDLRVAERDAAARIEREVLPRQAA
jgi:addiction module HigA family antidote